MLKMSSVTISPKPTSTNFFPLIDDFNYDDPPKWKNKSINMSNTITGQNVWAQLNNSFPI